MPITNADLPVRILDSFESAGVRFLVLHDEEKVGSAALTSDIDIVVDRPVSSVLPLLRQVLSENGLIVALIWPYDVGGGASLFFTDGEGSAGAQIDALYDHRGSGRYGLRSNRLFAGQRLGRRFPVPARLDGLLYVARKTSVKGRVPDLEAVRRVIDSEFTPEAVSKRVQELFSATAAKSLLVALRGGTTRWAVRPERWFWSVGRVAKRLARPIGSWVHVSGPESETKVRELHATFSAWLVRVELGHHPAGARAIPWWGKVVIPVRLRPGVFLSYSESRRRWPKADVQLNSGEDSRSLAASIVEAMARKAAQ